MSKMKDISSSEDEDIWDYKSVPKKMRNTQEGDFIGMSQSRKKSWIDDVVEKQNKKKVTQRRSSNVLACRTKHSSQSSIGKSLKSNDDIIKSYTQTLCSQRQGNKSVASKSQLQSTNTSSKKETLSKQKAKSSNVNIKTDSFMNSNPEYTANRTDELVLKAPSVSTSGEVYLEPGVLKKDGLSVNVMEVTPDRVGTLKKAGPPAVEVTPARAGTSGRTGRCPVCQMPFSALSVVQSPSWHVDECLDTPYTSNSTECSHGLECDSTIASHYKKFRHRLLARSNRKSGQQLSQSAGSVASAKVRLCFGGEEGAAPVSSTDASSLQTLGNECPDSARAQLTNEHNSKKVGRDLTRRDSNKENCSVIGGSAKSVIPNINDERITKPQHHDKDSIAHETTYCDNGKGSLDVSMNGEMEISHGVAVRVDIDDVEPSSSILDVDKITDNSRDISDMLEDIFGESEDTNDEPRQLDSGNDVANVPLDVPVSISDNSNDGESDCIRNLLTPGSFTEDIEDLSMTLLREKSNGAKDICDTDSRDSNRSFFLKKIESMESCKKDELTTDAKELKNFGKCGLETLHEDLGIQDSKGDLINEDSKPKVKHERTRAKSKRVNKKSRLKSSDDKHSQSIINNKKKTNPVEAKMNKSSIKGRPRKKENTYNTNQKSILSFFKDNVKKEESVVIMTDFSSDDETSSVHKNCCLNCEVNVSEKDQVNNAGTVICDNELEVINDNIVREACERNCDHFKGSNCTVQMQDACHVASDSGIVNSGNEVVNTTPKFHIESVYSLANEQSEGLGGGFFPDDDFDDTLTEMEDTLNLESGRISSGHSSFEGSARVSVENNKVHIESVENEPSCSTSLKSATDVLMAAGRSLCNKSVSSQVYEKYGLRAANSVGNGPGGGWKKRKHNSSAASSAAGEAEEPNYKRKCPFYKKIPGTSFTVDAFRYGEIADCKAYILSHFHYDHYGGLTKGFCQPIYCSQITGNLVMSKLRVDKRYVNTLPLNTPTMIEGVKVTFLEANHCPGAVLILFQLKSGRTYLHTGDFRANAAMEDYPALQNLRVHTLYLDTTYCDPQYVFPEQEKVVAFGVQLALEARTRNPKTLLVCGSYTIGKERIFTAIAESLDCKIAVTRDKKSVLECLEDDNLQDRITLNWADTGLHVLPMNKLNYKGLQEHLQKNAPRYNCVLGIEPTGWTYNKRSPQLESIKPKLNRDSIKLYGIPYSEHSSFLELKRFVQFSRPEKILATVNNGNVHSRTKMETIFGAWMEEIRRKK